MFVLITAVEQDNCGCYRILNIVPCAIEKDLVVYHLIYSSVYLLTPNPQFRSFAS